MSFISAPAPFKPAANGSSRIYPHPSKPERLSQESRSSLSPAHHEEEMGMANAHISALQSKHAELDARIEREEHRPQPDMTILAQLKKQKLKVKEEITGI
jgi:hypothetical protein